MSRIREDYVISEKIHDIVDDFLKGYYNEDDVLAITPEHGKLSIVGNHREMINITPDTDIYPLSSLLRDDENGGLEPDIDKINEIASLWVMGI